MGHILTEAQLDHFAHEGLLLIDNFLTNETAQQLLEEAKFWQAEEAFKNAGIGHLDKLHIQENYRADKIKWINKQDCLPATKAYMNTLEELMQETSRAFFLSLKDFESMYAIYPRASFYKKHKDQFEHQAHRIISLVLYLNEDWQADDGGQLVVYKEDEKTIIEPIFNRLAIFKSELWHEVLPCQSERFSVTSWFKDQLNEVNFL